MNRLNRALIAISVCGGLLGATHVYARQTAQTTQPMKPILSGKFTPPVRGVAEIQMTKPKIERKGNQLVTTFQVKNVSTAPVAGLRCDETLYDKAGALVTGGDQWRSKKLIEPGEIVTVVLNDELDPKINRNNYQFVHANGTVKLKQVPKF
jgi:hypothetical protein